MRKIAGGTWVALSCHMVGRVLFLVSLVSASPVLASPLSLRVQEAQLRRFERELSGSTLAFARDLVEQEGFACFDPVGIRQMDLQTQVVDLKITPSASDNRLAVSFTLPRVEVRGTVFADGGFPCFDVEAQLDPLAMTDVKITAAVAPGVTADGGLALEVIETSTTVGDVTITGSDLLADIEEQFGLIESMLPDLLDMAARQGVEMAAQQLDTYRIGVAYGIPYRADLTAVTVHDDGLTIAAEAAPGLATKASCLPDTAAAPDLTTSAVAASPLPAGTAPGAGALVSAAGDLPGKFLGAAWWAGLACGYGQLQPPQFLADTVAQITGKPSGTLRYSYSLAEAPRVELAAGRVHVAIAGAHVEIHDISGTLFLADFNLAVEGTASVDPDTRLVLAFVDDVQLSIGRLESALADGEDGRQEMRDFLEKNVASQLVEGVQGLPVADANFRSPGTGITVLELVDGEDGFRAALSPYFWWNDEIDTTPPQTLVGTPRKDGWKHSVVAVSATDDRPGTLVHAWSLDDGAWSPWLRDDQFRMETPPGTHTLTVMSRDRWGNVSAPVTTTFEVADTQTFGGGCACSVAGDGAAPGGGAMAIAFVAIALVAVRRRWAILLLLIPAIARADDTRVLPPKIFILSANGVYVLNNPPASLTGSTVAIPTGMMPLGIDAKARTQHRMEAQLIVPAVVVGVWPNVNVGAFLPIFHKAKVDVKEFEVRAAGVDVTSQAQAAMSDAGFRSPSGNEEDGPISDWEGRGIGDANVFVRWRAFGDRANALLLQTGLKIPTGKKDDPRILTDFGFGDGQYDVSLDLNGEHRFGRLVGGATGGYKLKLPGVAKIRPVGGPTVSTVKDPGDVMRAGVSARNTGAGMPWYALNGGVAVEHHLADRNTAGIETPDQRGTALVVNGAVGLSNVKWFLKHRLGLPAMFTVGASRSIALTGNTNLDVWQATARLDLIL